MRALFLILWMVGTTLALQAQSPRGSSAAVTARGRSASVSVSNSAKQVVLEQKVGEAWKPLAVAHPTRGGRVSFTLPEAIPASRLRATVYSSSKFPSRFRTAPRRFDRAAPASNRPMVVADGAVGGLRGLALASGQVVASGTNSSTPLPTAQQSDIWQIRGSRVFFFNQYRGLQVLDLRSPANPQRLGTLRLPASGEQMFVLNEAATKLALLGRSNDADSLGQLALWLVGINEAGQPSLTSKLTLSGSVVDTRLVGGVIHILSQQWGFAPQPGGVMGIQAAWGPRLSLVSVDVSDAAAPQVLGTLEWEGHSGVLQDAGDCLLVASMLPGFANEQGRLRVIDIGGAVPVMRKTLALRGWLQDKFKLGRIGDALVAITQDLSLGWQARQTWVETFPLTGESLEPLGSLEIEAARGESLYATRLDGDRLYAVTFLQVDPLFVIDLADPTKPALLGELKIPGFSTYIQPLGDRLLAVGVEDRHVTIKLFDVADPANPQEISKQVIGADRDSSWSEANYDEKAVAWLPQQGLLMVPFQSGWGAQAQRGIQVIHVTDSALQAGLTLNHDFDPRRGSWIDGYLVSISGQELRVQGADQAHAATSVNLPLAWRTDRILVMDEHLVQIEDGELPRWNFWGMTSRLALWPVEQYARCKIRVTPKLDPDALTQQLDLGQGAVVASAQRGDRLYLLLWAPASAQGEVAAHLKTVVVNLSANQPVAVSGAQVLHDLEAHELDQLRLDAVQGLWPSENKLVWFLPARVDFWGGYCFEINPTIMGAVVSSSADANSGPAVASSTVAQSTSLRVDPAWSQGNQRVAAALLPCRVIGGEIQALESQWIQPVQSVTRVSQAVAAAGLVFFSYDVSLIKDVVTQTQASTSRILLNLGSMISLPGPRRREARVESWLRVVDWRAEQMALRDEVSIPGELIGVVSADEQGSILLTHADRQIKPDLLPVREVHASAYDGAAAWQLASYVTATSFFTAMVSDGQRIYLARDQAQAPGVEAIGYEPVNGRLGRLGQWNTARTPSLLSVVDGHLLASSWGNVEVAKISDGPSIGGSLLRPLAAYDTPANLWLRVDRAVLQQSTDLWVPAGMYGVELLRATPQP